MVNASAILSNEPLRASGGSSSATSTSRPRRSPTDTTGTFFRTPPTRHVNGLTGSLFLRLPPNSTPKSLEDLSAGCRFCFDKGEYLIYNDLVEVRRCAGGPDDLDLIDDRCRSDA